MTISIGNIASVNSVVQVIGQRCSGSESTTSNEYYMTAHAMIKVSYTWCEITYPANILLTSIHYQEYAVYYILFCDGVPHLDW